MTIHELKSKLNQLRGPKNRAKHISSLPEVITFDLTIEISFSLVLWKLDIHIFPGISRSAQSEFKKAFKYASEAELGKKPGLLMSALGPVPTKGLPNLNAESRIVTFQLFIPLYPFQIK